MDSPLPSITEQRRMKSPAVTPQALAWHEGKLWMGSRDLRRIFAIDPFQWTVLEERDAPGIPWAAVAAGNGLMFTIGDGEDDDRYLRRYVPGREFSELPRIACPEFTGSYLSYDGKNFYLSQWYKHRVLRLGSNGAVLFSIDVGAEISGQTYVDGAIYVLRGTEQDGENWKIARFDPFEERPVMNDLARVPFACRSLAFDGERFWTNHRAADEMVAFVLPR